LGRSAWENNRNDNGGDILDKRFIGARRWGHIADLARLTFRLLHRREDFLAKRLARRILTGAYE
jgi:hypothetical protein